MKDCTRGRRKTETKQGMRKNNKQKRRVQGRGQEGGGRGKSRNEKHKRGREAGAITMAGVSKAVRQGVGGRGRSFQPSMKEEPWSLTAIL